MAMGLLCLLALSVAPLHAAACLQGLAFCKEPANTDFTCLLRRDKIRNVRRQLTGVAPPVVYVLVKRAATIPLDL